jgi:hypothetical protein
MKKIIEYALARLSENSTWRGIILLLTAVGVTVNTEQAEHIIAAGLAVIGVINVFRKGVKPAAEKEGVTQ